MVLYISIIEFPYIQLQRCLGGDFFLYFYSDNIKTLSFLPNREENHSEKKLWEKVFKWDYDAEC